MGYAVINSYAPMNTLITVKYRKQSIHNPPSSPENINFIMGKFVTHLWNFGRSSKHKDKEGMNVIYTIVLVEVYLSPQTR